MSFSHRLSDSLRRALGDDAAGDLVEWTDQVEERRIEAAEFREMVRGDLAEMRHEIQRLRLDMVRGFYILGAVCVLNTVVSLAALVVALIALLK